MFSVLRGEIIALVNLFGTYGLSFESSIFYEIFFLGGGGRRFLF